MQTRHIKTMKFAVIVLFILAAVLSVQAVGRVVVNYNISDYLDESTETKISLTIIEDEFGQTGNIQVMVEDIDLSTALGIRDTLVGLDSVLSVSFNEASQDSYKDGDALFVVLVDGDDYSEAANTLLSDIQNALDGELAEKTQYGGTVMEKKNLRSAIESEIVFILGISVCLVTAIMLLTSKSWLEPIILWIASGVAVLLNLGSNVIFDEISYITNAVAAILQLALSIDYSIVLLHHYRSVKETEEDRHRAMLRSVKEVLNPVSASALTTIAGLLALLFMTLKIGFDIGIVLMKGILISAVTSLTLFPALLLLCERLMEKTRKKDLVLNGKFFCKLAFKGGKVLVPVALALVLICGALQLGNTYAFTDSKNANAAIIDRFGRNNSVIVIYPNSENGFDKEIALSEKLTAYRTANGMPALKGYTAYTNTVRELYDVDKAANTLDLDPDDVEMLFTMYHLYGDPERVRLSFGEFMNYSAELIDGDPTVENFVSDTSAKTMDTVLAVGELMSGTHTAAEFHALANDGAPEGSTISLFPIQQMYGLYHYGEVEEASVDFTAMLSFMLKAAEDPETADFFTEAAVNGMTQLVEGLALLKKPMTTADMVEQLASQLGVDIPEFMMKIIYKGYFRDTGLETVDTIPYLTVLDYMAETGFITDTAALEALDDCHYALSLTEGAYTYDAFLSALADVAEALTGEAPTLDVSDEAIQQIYILYFYENQTLPMSPIEGRVFVDFVLRTYPENQMVSSQLSEQTKLLLSDMVTLDKFLNDTALCTYPEMQDRLEKLIAAIQSMSVTEAMSEELVSGIYIKYAMAKRLGLTDSVMACDLVDFVLENMDENPFLKARMTDKAREGVLAARNKMDGAADLPLAENYSRMLLSVDLPNEGADSTAFVEFLTASVKEIMGEEAHVAGEMISTYDLQTTFDGDNRLITVFTIVSIFLIVLIIFRSISLPVLLVTIIQGAIWICMSTSLLTGPMFFMSYIIATCILMGATIDYGILMSSTYINARAAMDRKEALLKAVEAALPTVFTSGLILTVCGFVVSLISSQTSISTVGFLLGKGTIVSCLMITLVLPSVLYLLDSFILKLTLRKKNK